jgi:membrane-bound acyltransferase YfiQ involved in biofilm formation
MKEVKEYRGRRKQKGVPRLFLYLGLKVRSIIPLLTLRHLGLSMIRAQERLLVFINKEILLVFGHFYLKYISTIILKGDGPVRR